MLGALPQPTLSTETPSSPAAAFAAAQAAAAGVGVGSLSSATSAIMAAQVAAVGIGGLKKEGTAAMHRVYYDQKTVRIRRVCLLGSCVGLDTPCVLAIELLTRFCVCLENSCFRRKATESCNNSTPFPSLFPFP